MRFFVTVFFRYPGIDPSPLVRHQFIISSQLWRRYLLCKTLAFNFIRRLFSPSRSRLSMGDGTWSWSWQFPRGLCFGFWSGLVPRFRRFLVATLHSFGWRWVHGALQPSAGWTRINQKFWFLKQVSPVGIWKSGDQAKITAQNPRKSYTDFNWLISDTEQEYLRIVDRSEQSM